MVLTSACGYRFAGQGQFPKGVEQIFIQTFENRTSKTGIERVVTNQIIFEFTRQREKSLAGSAETSDAVLVADRKQSHEIGALAKQLQQQGRTEASLHRCAFRPWGSYTVLEKSPGYQVKRLSLKPGAILSLQRHQFRAEHWVVVKGQASIVHGDDKLVLNENESTYIPAGMIHQLANKTDKVLEVIEVQTGSYLEEDDIERLDDPYQRLGTSG